MLWPLLEVLGWCAFCAYRMSQAVRTPAVWQDSEAYRAVSLHGLFSSALWSGARAPLVPVLLKLTGGQYFNYVVAQAVIGVLAWGFLAWTASRVVAAGWRRLVVFWAVLAFATAPLVVQWDWSVLSESPSLSALAVGCACGLWLVRGFTWVRLAGLGAAALAYVWLRDADIWDVGLVGLLILLYGAAETIRGAALEPGTDFGALRGNVRRNWVRTRRSVTVGLVLLGVSVVAATGAFASHRNVENVEEAFYVRIFPYPDRVAWFARHGMPEAPAVDSLAAVTSPPAPGQAPIVAPDLTSPSWAPLKQWFESDGLTTYAAFLLTNPTYVLFAPFSSPALTYNNASGRLSFYDPTGHLTLAGFGTVFTPDKFVVIAMAALALLVAGARRVYARREWVFVACFGIVGLVSMLLAWHGEGMEVTRHMVEGNVEVRLSVLLLLLLSVLADPVPRRGAHLAAAGSERRAAHVESEPARDGATESEQVVPVGAVPDPADVSPGAAT